MARTPVKPPVAHEPPAAVRAAFILLLGLLVSLVYGWSPEEFRARIASPEPTEFYHEYADALLAGQLALARLPEPQLVALSDPYDPVANAPYRVNDLSYHNGRYYLYHGIVPALVLLAPFRVITGEHLSLAWASWTFLVLGATASLALTCDFRRHLAPKASLPVAVAGVIVLVFAQGAHGVLRDGNLNQLPIAAAYGFAMIALWAVWRGRLGTGSTTRWLALASASGGLAVGCRPNYVFAVSALMGVALLVQVRAGRSRGDWLRLALAGLLPLMTCVGALLLLNQIRFGHPLEFGMRTMLGAWDQRQLPALAWTSVAANLNHYLLVPGLYSPRFPFVSAPSWESIGVLLHAPVVWLAALCLVRPLSGSPLRQAVVLPLAAFAVVSFAVLVFLPSGNATEAPTSANVRYLLDWQPGWVLLAVLASLGTSHAFALQKSRARAFNVAVVLLGLASVLAGLSLDLGRYPASSVRTVARWMSLPVWWAEAVSRPDYGPVALEVRFPSEKLGAREPLLAVGNATAGDLVYVIYDSPTSLRFGLVSIGRKGPVSSPVDYDPGLSHQLELHLGPLFPPVSHPLLADFTDDEVASLSRRLVIRMDGKTVMDAPVAFAAPGGADVALGKTSFLLDYASSTFSGELLAGRRASLHSIAPKARAPVFGPVRLTIELPEAKTSGADPLLTTGQPQAGDVVYVAYQLDGTVRFGLDHWGHRGLLGDAVELDRTRPHEVEISTGSLYPHERHTALAGLSREQRRRLKQRVSVRVDGRTVLEGTQATYDSSPYDVHPGLNPIGASSTEYQWAGRISEIERLPLDLR